MMITPKFESSFGAGRDDVYDGEEVREVSEEDNEHERDVLDKEEDEKERIKRVNWKKNLDELKRLGRRDVLFDHLANWHEYHPLALNVETDAHEVARHTAKENSASNEIPKGEIDEDDGEEGGEEANAMYSEFAKPTK